MGAQGTGAGLMNDTQKAAGQGNLVQQETQNAGEDQNLTIQQQTGDGKGQGASQGSGQGNVGAGQGTGQGNLVQQETQNAGEDQNLTIQQQTGQGRFKSQQLEQVRQRIQGKKQQMDQELSGMGNNKEKQKVFQNQNRVRLAVHSLLALENLTGGIGQQVSQIAKEFDNSVQSTLRSEERIQTRGGLSKFFFGGDEEASDEILGQVTQNQERIQELNRLMLEGGLDEDVKTMMQEQIRVMQQEQNRLQQMAQQEKMSKGLLGWLWK
jgi:hypothetical protein